MSDTDEPDASAGDVRADARQISIRTRMETTESRQTEATDFGIEVGSRLDKAVDVADVDSATFDAVHPSFGSGGNTATLDEDDPDVRDPDVDATGPTSAQETRSEHTAGSDPAKAPVPGKTTGGNPSLPRDLTIDPSGMEYTSPVRYPDVDGTPSLKPDAAHKSGGDVETTDRETGVILGKVTLGFGSGAGDEVLVEGANEIRTGDPLFYNGPEDADADGLIAVNSETGLVAAISETQVDDTGYDQVDGTGDDQGDETGAETSEEGSGDAYDSGDLFDDGDALGLG